MKRFALAMIFYLFEKFPLQKEKSMDRSEWKLIFRTLKKSTFFCLIITATFFQISEIVNIGAWNGLLQLWYFIVVENFPLQKVKSMDRSERKLIFRMYGLKFVFLKQNRKKKYSSYRIAILVSLSMILSKLELWSTLLDLPVLQRKRYR